MVNRHNLVNIIQELDFLISKSSFDDIDKKIKELDIESSHSSILICYLRGTFIIKDFLSEWKFLLYKTQSELKRRNLDSDKILMGLLDGK